MCQSSIDSMIEYDLTEFTLNTYKEYFSHTLGNRDVYCKKFTAYYWAAYFSYILWCHALIWCTSYNQFKRLFSWTSKLFDYHIIWSKKYKFLQFQAFENEFRISFFHLQTLMKHKCLVDLISYAVAVCRCREFAADDLH